MQLLTVFYAFMDNSDLSSAMGCFGDQLILPKQTGICHYFDIRLQIDLRPESFADTYFVVPWNG